MDFYLILLYFIVIKLYCIFFLTPVLTTVQSKGLPDWYGVITLRVHCGGTQHIQSIRIKFQRVKCVTMKLTVLVRGMNTLDIGAG